MLVIACIARAEMMAGSDEEREQVRGSTTQVTGAQNTPTNEQKQVNGVCCSVNRTLTIKPYSNYHASRGNTEEACIRGMAAIPCTYPRNRVNWCTWEQRSNDDHYWRDGGGELGYDATGDDDINSDPVMRVCQRCDEIECGGGVLDADGYRVRWDEDERKHVGGRRGHEAAWRARSTMMNLHLRHHFKHVAYTDASKTCDAVAGGVWEGVQEQESPEAVTGGRIQEALRRAAKDSGERDVTRRVGRGLWGMRLPSHWEIYDAEMYTMIAYMRSVLHRIRNEHAEPGDILIVSDSLGALRSLEQVWREGKYRQRRIRNAAMLEVACAVV